LPSAPAAPPDLASRADLAAAAREVERAEALGRLSRRFVEAPAVGLGWKRVENGPAAASGPVVSVAWTIPLFDRRQAERRAADGELAAARAGLEVAQARAHAELGGIRTAFERLRTAAEDATRAAADTDKILAAAAASYRLGESGLTDLLDTLRAALGIRITAVEAEAAALAAHRDLELAVGRPLTFEGGMR
jgi:outer membrane protein TolC